MHCKNMVIIIIIIMSPLSHHITAKVKESHYRPGQALMFQQVEHPRFQDNLAHEGGKVVSPTHRPHLPPRKYSRYLVLSEAESTPGP